MTVHSKGLFILIENLIGVLFLGKPEWNETKKMIHDNYIERPKHFIDHVKSSQELDSLGATGFMIKLKQLRNEGATTDAQLISHLLMPTSLRVKSSLRLLCALAPLTIGGMACSDCGIAEETLSVRKESAVLDWKGGLVKDQEKLAKEHDR